MELSSYTIFAEKIRGKNIGRGKLYKRFLKEVDKKDYLPSEEDKIVEFLVGITCEATPHIEQKI